MYARSSWLMANSNSYTVASESYLREKKADSQCVRISLAENADRQYGNQGHGQHKGQSVLGNVGL